MNQLSFSDEAYTYKKKTTRKERFLGEMDEVLPWDDLLQPILRKYPKPGQGRRPIPAATMLRIYFMQQWYGLSDPGMEDSLYDVASMRRFAGVALDAIPDETTICKFRHFLERHRLTEVLFERTGQYLSERGLIVREGTIVDATILAAPTSTKNRDQARDPQMGSTKKGTTWHFGLKAHVGSDPQGRVHTVVVTSASVHDSQMMEGTLADCYGTISVRMCIFYSNLFYSFAASPAARSPRLRKKGSNAYDSLSGALSAAAAVGALSK